MGKFSSTLRRGVIAVSIAGLCFSAPAGASPKNKLRDELKAVHDTMFVRDDGTTPFRLTATFHAMGYLGQPQGEGSIEEFWLKRGTWKVTAGYSGATITLYAADDKYSVTGASFLSLVPARALDAIRSTAPTSRQIDDAPGFEEQVVDLGNAKLKCISMQQKVLLTEPLKEPLTSTPSTTFCADDKNIVHAQQQRSIHLFQSHDNFLLLNGRYQPRDITVQIVGQQRMAVHIVNIAAIPSLSAADIAPPSDASAVCTAPELPGTSNRLVSAHRKNVVQVQRSEIVTGTGSLETVVDRDGQVADLDVATASSKPLADMLLKQARQQSFTPATCDGVPVPQKVTITYNVREASTRRPKG